MVKMTNYRESSFEPFVALIMTMATNLEEMEFQYSPYPYRTYNGILVPMLLRSHSTSEPRPLAKLTKVTLKGQNDDFEHWVRVPPKATQLVLREQVLRRFQFPSEAQAYEISQSKISIKLFTDLSQGFAPTLRTLDICRCTVWARPFMSLLASDYCQLVETLKLSKIGPSYRYYRRYDWSTITPFLRKHLPNPRTLDISIWWDEHSGTRPRDSSKRIGGLQNQPSLQNVSIDNRLLLKSFRVHANNALLGLPSRLPQGLTDLSLLGFPVSLLDQIAQVYDGGNGRNVLAEIMAQLSEYVTLKIVTFEKPYEGILKTMQVIGSSLWEKGVHFSVWWEKDHDGWVCLVGEGLEDAAGEGRLEGGDAVWHESSASTHMDIFRACLQYAICCAIIHILAILCIRFEIWPFA